MKKILILLLICFAVSLQADEISEKLNQIGALKNEIKQNLILVEQKINDLKNSNPLFAEQDPFESDMEYLGRMSKAMPQIDRLRKQYLSDLWLKMSILRGKLFETKNITVTFDSKNYDPNTEEWKVTVDHLNYQKEHYEIILKIAKADAGNLFKNIDKLQKIGILSIDVGDKIGLAKLSLTDPVSAFEYEYEFQPMKSFKHYNDVNSVAFSPDGKFLATGSSKDKAKIFNLETGNEVKSFKHYDHVNSVAFSPDGKFLATGSSDSNARIFNLETGAEVKSFKLNRVNSVAFSPDGKFLATGSYDNNARIFNLETGNEVKSFKHYDSVYSVAFSPDGKFLATGSYDNKAKIFNLETGNKVKSFKHNNLVNSVAFSPDGKFLATGSDNAYLYRTLFQVEEEVMAQKTILRPPLLSAIVNFTEPNGNLFLDAMEEGIFKITITNNGSGAGKGILIKTDPERTANLNYNNAYIEQIDPGKSVTVDIAIEAYIGVENKNHTFRFNFEEINSFPPDPVEIQFSTKSYIKPELFIVDVGIEDSNDNGMIESGEIIKLTVRLGNKGKGVGIASYAKFYTGDNVFITDTYPKTVSLGDIAYNGQIDVPLEFFVNDKTKDEIPLFVDITESTSLATVNKLRLPIKKSERVRTIQKTVVSGIEQKYDELSFKSDLSVDIEQNIPESNRSYNNALAVIFGIENYRNVSNVNFAYRDATIMKEYFSKTIGIPEEQIYFRANDEVTLGEFRKIFSDKGWLDKRVIENETDIYFYYAGHGAPAIKEKQAFLIPVDGDPNYPVLTGYSLETVYDNLSSLNANSVTVFLDACFTGANRENEMLLADARPVSIQLKNNYVNNVTVFSATSSNEISSSYPKNKHGLFSYFLMKGMQGEADSNKDNKLTINELYEYTKKNVSRTAGTLDREQTPQLECLEPEKIIINY